LVLGYGFSGGDFDLPSGEVVGIIAWSVASLFIFSAPALALAKGRSQTGLLTSAMGGERTLAVA